MPSPFLSRRPRALTCLAGVVGLTSAVLLTFAAPASASAPVDLGPTASTFAVLGGTSVTNTSTSMISGNVGTSPGYVISGFPPGQITNGTKHAADGPASTAQGELTAAYLRAAASGPTTATYSDVGGKTLVPGVYTSASSMALNGALTLDGGGNADAMFVFQAGSSLLVAGSSTVSLINGANACNVYWQVGSSATLGSSATFVGSVLALTSITAGHQASVSGRLLARNGNVTLDDNTITDPDCSTPPGGGGSSSSGPGGSTSPASSSSSRTPPSSTSAAHSTGSGAAPTVKGVSPANGPTAGGTVVTVSGTGFRAGSTSVKVGNTTIPSSSVTVLSSTSLRFRLPAHPAGRVTITVSTRGRTSRTFEFTYETTQLLASTGTPTSQLLVLASLLLVSGVATLSVGRRRPHPRRH